MGWKCQKCGGEFESFRGYANHYNLTGDHEGNALAEAVGCGVLEKMYSTQSENSIASELGVSRNAVQSALNACNIDRRGRSEAERLKNQNLTKDERQQQTKAAREEHFEKYGDGGHIIQWVEQNPEKHAEHCREVASLGAEARDENGMAGRTGQDHPNWRGGKRIYDAVKKQLTPPFGSVKDDARADECYKCGASDCKLDVHHIVPIMAGGVNEEWNFMTLCESCHRTVEAHTRDLPGMDPVLVE